MTTRSEDDGAPDPSACPVGGDPASLRERKKLRNRLALHEAACDLVLEHGLAEVSIEDICARAGLSNRTFFNYFPTKASAVIGFTVPQVDADVERRFLERAEASGLVAGVCLLIALTLPGERQRAKTLLSRRPELTPAFHSWIGELRTSILATVGTRTDAGTAALAVALVIAALPIVLEGPVSEDPEMLAARLQDVVERMQALGG